MQRVSNIFDFEWWIVLGGTALLDVVQIILELFIIGEAVNRFIDLGYALSITFYLWIRDYPMEWRVLILIFSTFFVELLPVLDAAPFWVYDVWKLRGWDIERRQQNKQLAEQLAQEEFAASQLAAEQAAEQLPA